MTLNQPMILRVLSNAGFVAAVDHESPWMVIVRLKVEGLSETYVMRLGADRATVWYGSQRIANVAGKDWLIALATAIKEIEKHTAQLLVAA